MAGRNKIINLFILQKLEEAFLLDCTDEEACLYACIATRTLYYFQEQNPEFLQRKQLLKSNPVLLARRTLIKGIKTDPHLALKYLERKKKDEFSLRSEVKAEVHSHQLMGNILDMLEQQSV